MIHVFDLSDSKNVDQLVKNCPKIDILVNNAGAIPAGDIQAVEEDRWRAAWDLKVFGYINMTRRYYPIMRDAGGGVTVSYTHLTLPTKRIV